MLKGEEPRFSNDEEQRPLLAERELRDACLYAAAIVVVAYSLGCEFKDCMLDDDGYPWPTATTRIEIKYPEDWRWKRGIFPIVGAIHEAGAAAVCKQHDHGPCRINNNYRTAQLLDDPVIWATIKALARLIQDSEFEENGCGVYGAMGTDCCEPGDDSDAIALMKGMGVHPGYGWKIMPPDADEEDDDA
jgi:hypothetical protein